MSGINSPIRITGGQHAPDGTPENIRPYIEDLYAAIQQLQAAFVQYAGVGPADASIWSQLTPDQSILVQNMGRLYGKASENIAYGAMINVFDDGISNYNIRNANATNNTKPAHGYCNVVGGIAAAAYGECIVGQGLCLAIAGLTRGAKYYLSTVNGLITTVAPVAAGNIEQYLGFAFLPTQFMFNAHYWIQH